MWVCWQGREGGLWGLWAVAAVRSRIRAAVIVKLYAYIAEMSLPFVETLRRCLTVPCHYRFPPASTRHHTTRHHPTPQSLPTPLHLKEVFEQPAK